LHWRWACYLYGLRFLLILHFENEVDTQNKSDMQTVRQGRVVHCTLYTLRSLTGSLQTCDVVMLNRSCLKVWHDSCSCMRFHRAMHTHRVFDHIFVNMYVFQCLCMNLSSRSFNNTVCPPLNVILANHPLAISVSFPTCMHGSGQLR
jgi:hypothetical protein